MAWEATVGGPKCPVVGLLWEWDQDYTTWGLWKNLHCCRCWTGLPCVGPDTYLCPLASVWWWLEWTLLHPCTSTFNQLWVVYECKGSKSVKARHIGISALSICNIQINNKKCALHSWHRLRLLWASRRRKYPERRKNMQLSSRSSQDCTNGSVQ